MRDGIALARKGKPAVALVTEVFKAQGDFIDEVKSLGCTQWTYQREGRDTPTAMPYWTLPEACLDDPDEARALASRALSYL